MIMTRGKKSEAKYKQKNPPKPPKTKRITISQGNILRTHQTTQKTTLQAKFSEIFLIPALLKRPNRKKRKNLTT